MNDERLITESIAKEGNAVYSTIQSRGWQNVIQPALNERLNALMEDFCGASTYEEFVRIQQSVNAIKGLLNFIEVKLIEGKTAVDELRGKP